MLSAIVDVVSPPRLNLRGLACALALFAIPVADGYAETVKFAERDVVVAAPAGSCAMDPSIRFDAALIDLAERHNSGYNSVLLVFGDCDSLPRWRRREIATFASWGQILAPLNRGEARPAPPASRAEIVRAIAAILPHLPWQDIAREVKDRVAQPGTGLQIEAMTSLGSLEVNDTALFQGVLVPLVLPDSRRMTVAGVVGTTVVNQIVVSINLYRPFVDEGTFATLLEEQRLNILALIRANGG